MSLKTGFLTARELAAMNLADVLPTSERGVLKRAQRECWPSRERAGQGGGREYEISRLPEAVRFAVEAVVLRAQPSALPAPPAATGAPSGAVIPLPVAAAASAGSGAAGALVAAPGGGAVAALADWQRDVLYARLGVLRLVDALAAAAGTVDAAIARLQGELAAGAAPAETLRLVERANARAGGLARINRSTLYRWRALREAGGDAALAPADARHFSLPPWTRAALDLWRQPAKPSIRFVAEKLPAVLATHGIEPPSYGQLRRFINQRLGALARQDGRMGPRELKNISPYVRRDSSKMYPTDGYTADGHTFDAEVAHPHHKRPFRPEITSVLDIATRKCVGWSLALSENAFAVLDAQRRAFMTHGVCAIWYVDRGSGYRNEMQHSAEKGIADRLSFTISHSLPYNSQARGVMERSHRTIWVEAARRLPTFINQVMDAERKQKVFRLTRRDVRQTGTSRLLMPWEELVPYLQAAVDAYNDRPHRALPRVKDAAGRLRHLSPNEYWAKFVADGFEPVMVAPEQADALFRPQEHRKVERGQVKFLRGVYFHADLAEWDGQWVRVAYDIHDSRTVLVLDGENRLICEAVRDGNLRDYFPQSVLAAAAEKRAKGRARRLQAQMDEVHEELAGSNVIEHAPSPAAKFDWPETAGAIPAAATDAQAGGDVAQVGAPFAGEEAAASPARPTFSFFFERYEWLMENRGAWTEQDRAFLARYVASEDYADSRERYEAMGIAWKDDASPSFKSAG